MRKQSAAINPMKDTLWHHMNPPGAGLREPCRREWSTPDCKDRWHAHTTASSRFFATRGEIDARGSRSVSSPRRDVQSAPECSFVPVATMEELRPRREVGSNAPHQDACNASKPHAAACCNWCHPARPFVSPDAADRTEACAGRTSIRPTLSWLDASRSQNVYWAVYICFADSPCHGVAPGLPLKSRCDPRRSRPHAASVPFAAHRQNPRQSS
jgi:hypothetical protein